MISAATHQASLMQHSIHWPNGLVPGEVDNFVSNEIVVAGLTPNAALDTLIDTRTWAAQYDNATDIEFHDGQPPHLTAGLRFQFVTFGLPVQAEITELERATDDSPARIAWHGWTESDDPNEQLDVHHAWLFEALPGDRLRLLTQETQNGAPARDMATTTPNPPCSTNIRNGSRAWPKSPQIATAKGLRRANQPTRYANDLENSQAGRPRTRRGHIPCRSRRQCQRRFCSRSLLLKRPTPSRCIGSSLWGQHP